MNRILPQYFAAVRFLESLNNLHHNNPDRQTAFVSSKKRMLLFLQALNNPHLKIPNYIHVSGTSGKGSVVHMFHEIFQQAGYKVGSTVSPHIQATTERIRIGRHYISATDFIRQVRDIKKALEKLLPITQPPSYAEILFCLTLKAFAEAGCDWAVIEVSCGGRTDFTNIIPAPRLAVITNIGHDHEHLIGPSLKHIAREKAGIIKPGSIMLCGEQRPTLRRVLEQECQRQNAEAIFLDNGLAKKISARHLNGNHQRLNAKLVSIGAARLGVDARRITKGLATVRVPARFELIQQKPLVIIDGAHNPEKMRATAQAFAKLPIKGKRRLILSLSAGKNAAAILKHILPLTDDIIITRHTNLFRKVIEPIHLFGLIKTLRPNLKPLLMLDAREAYKIMLARTKPHDAVLVTGSLFTAGEIRDLWFLREKIILQKTSFPK